MDILKAIDAMRDGAKVLRAQHIGATVAGCWLALELVYNDDSDSDEVPHEVIYFHAAPVRAEDGWVAVTQGTKNVWMPSQSDLFVDDFVVIDGDHPMTRVDDARREGREMPMSQPTDRKTAADISLADALDFVCEHLPEGWTTLIDASSGEIMVARVDPEGLTIADLGSEADVLQMIVDNVNEARREDGLCAVGLDGEHDTEWQDAESRERERELFGAGEETPTP